MAVLYRPEQSDARFPLAVVGVGKDVARRLPLFGPGAAGVPEGDVPVTELLI